MIQEQINTDIGVYLNIELKKLKQRLKSLEQKIQKLSLQKTEYLNDIDEFNILHSIHLGNIIQKTYILKQNLLEKFIKDSKNSNIIKTKISEIKKKIRALKKEMKSTLENSARYCEIIEEYTDLYEILEKLEDRFSNINKKDNLSNDNREDDDKIHKMYENLKSEYESFSKEYEDIQESLDDTCDISSDEKEDLTKLRNKAAKLCHPDLVADEFKAQANEIMQSLNEAYSNRDISRVKEILKDIECGTIFAVQSDTIDDEELLKVKIDELFNHIEKLHDDIYEIKHDGTFITIQSIDDMDIYFKNQKKELEENYAYIKKNKIIY